MVGVVDPKHISWGHMAQATLARSLDDLVLPFGRDATVQCPLVDSGLSCSDFARENAAGSELAD